MTVELPKFVTHEFLREIFASNYGDENLSVKSFRAEWATKKGDNYASEMYRVHVEIESNGEVKSRPILLKVIMKKFRVG